MLKYFRIPFSSKAYNEIFKFFDLHCNESINKAEFCDRLKVLSDKNFDVILNRFFDLVDT